MLRVCLLTRYFNFQNAGLGRVAMEMQRGLVSRGHSIGTIETRGTSLYSYFYYTLIGIRGQIPKDEGRVYHALTPMEAMWIPKKRSLVTFCDLFQLTHPDRLGSGLGYSPWKNYVGTRYFRIAAKVATRCEKIVAISEATKRDLIETFEDLEGRIQVIRLGIRSSLNPWPKRDSVFRLGYLGQLDRRKRVHLLIEAFKQSDLQELVIGGAGPDESLLKALAYGDSRIKFLGLIPDNELVDFYNSLDVFVFPTWLEGYGLPIVEAMACKKPVIVLADAEIPLEVKERCIIVNDLVEAFSAIKNVFEPESIEDNYKWAKEHSWDRTVEKYIELYEEILNG